MKDYSRKNSDLSLMAKCPLQNSSFDTESTESTSNCSGEIEQSYSNVSFYDRSDDDDIETPSTVRQRGTRSLLRVFDEAWSDVGRNNMDPHRNGDRRHSKDGKLPYGSPRHPNKIMGLLVFMIVALMTMPTIHRRLAVQKWKRAFVREGRNVLNDIRGSPSGATFTVVLHGSRLDLLKRAVDAHSQCSEVSEIQVEYHGDGGVFPNYLHRYGRGKVSRVGPLSTTGVFVGDEGVIFSCEDLQNAFRIWKRDPKRLVSFPADPPGDGKSPPNSRNEDLPRKDSAFVHRRYLAMAAPAMIPTVCSPQLLSAQVAAISRASPVLVKASPQQLLRQPLNAGTTNGPAYYQVSGNDCSDYRERLQSLQGSSLKSSQATTVIGSR